MSDRTKLLDTVEKLLAKGHSTTNAAEAAAFLGKAAEMMSAAGYTKGDLDRNKIKEALVKSTQSVSKPKPWEVLIVRTVADSFGCGVLWQAGHSNNVDYWGRYILIGPGDYIKLAEYAVANLVRQASKARAQEAKRISVLGWKRGKATTSHLEGYVYGWARSVSEAAKRFAVETNSELAAIVSEVTAERASGEAKGRKIHVDPTAYKAGLKDGESVELQRPMTSGEAVLQIK